MDQKVEGVAAVNSARTSAISTHALKFFADQWPPSFSLKLSLLFWAGRNYFGTVL